VSQDEGAMPRIEWFARTKKVYGVYYLNSLNEGAAALPVGTWTAVVVNSDGLTNVVDAAAAGATSRYYLIKVRRSP
jgi:hypothetical protein